MSDFSIEISYNSDFGSQGLGNGQFNYPSRSTILNDELFVVDKQNNRIQVFDLSGNYLRQFGTVGAGNDNFFFPEDIENDGTDLFIVDSANHRIKKHQVDGTYLSQFGTEGSGNDNFKYPIGITYNGINLYITDKQNHRVKVHQLNGTYLSQFGTVGTGNDNFLFPEGIDIVNNDLIIADSGNEDVKKFNVSGVFISKVTDILFGYPVGITNIDDNIYCVTDRTRNKLYFFDNINNFIKDYGSVGSGNDEFFFPISASYDNEKLFIVDSANYRVKILDAVPVTDVPIFTDTILKLTKQLYPTGRSWWLKYENTFSNLHEGLALSESRALQNNTDLLNSILPDNDNFTEEDAFNWERALGLYISTGLSLEDRKAAIERRMKHPGDIPARQHYLYLQGQLRDAGFDVYVHENRVDIGGGNYVVINIVPSLYGGVNYGDNVYGNIGITNYSKIANYVDETKDNLFDFGDQVSLRSTIIIGGSVLGSRANVDENRKNEFRHLILTIKPVQVSGFLLIDYI